MWLQLNRKIEQYHASEQQWVQMLLIGVMFPLPLYTRRLAAQAEAPPCQKVLRHQIGPWHPSILALPIKVHHTQPGSCASMMLFGTRLDPTLCRV
jgi:hypothetical protein